jgi:O-antigen/teichoic acid export membrane protein
MSRALGPLRTIVLRGLAWNTGYQVLAALVQFAAMLVVVRIISPEEYGHWAVTLGILQVLSAVSIANSLSHALQLQVGEQPDWTLHWHSGNALQLANFALCNAIAAVLARGDDYRPVSVLLSIASIGVLVNTPAQMRLVMLQRRLDFRRLRMVTASSSLLSAAVIVAGAMMGLGAKALVLGGNVVISLPAILDLMLVERWRPQGAWFAWPDLRRYRDSLVFGMARVGASLLAASRGALNAAVLPTTLGFEAIGLINRGEGLFAMSVGRVVGLLSETVYPILPQLTGDRARFCRVARAFSLGLVTLALGGLALFAASGEDLSRVLYGERWRAADPLLLPGAVVGVAMAMSTVSSQLLLARGRLRRFLTLDAASRLLVLPAFVGVLAFDWSMVTFAWVLSGPLAAGALAALYWVGRQLEPGTMKGILTGPAAVALAACVATLATGWAMPQASPALRAGAGVVVFALTWWLALRTLFPSILGELLELVPAQLRRQLTPERQTGRRNG